MDFKNFDWSLKSILKAVGLLAVALVVLGIAFALMMFAFRTVFTGMGGSSYEKGYYSDGIAMDYGMNESSSIQSLSKKISVPSEPIEDNYATGNNAEDFEIREHNGTINTRNLSKTCGEISELKKLDYVIFENANESKTSCYYSFKVAIANENEILGKIKALDPEYFNTQIYTIKKITDDYDSELEILEKKLASIETTLSDAQNAYNDLQKLATEKEDIESLAKIIDSKLNLIDRLTQQRIEIRTEIDQFNKSKAEQLDRLSYAYLNLNVYEDLYIDFNQIKNSWKYEFKAFIDNLNSLVQSIVIYLPKYVLYLVVGSLFFFVSMGMLKIVWKITKRIFVGKK